jgi:hypothetical protein
MGDLLPDPVIHVGLHRTATTWWQQELFAAHPALALVNDHVRPWRDPVLRSLVAVSDRSFDAARTRAAWAVHPGRPGDGDERVPVLSAERLSGHPFSGGVDALAIAGRIVAAFPQARVVIGIREQVSWLVSLYGQMVREGYPGTIREFAFGSRWKGSGFGLDYLLLDRLVEAYLDGLGPARVLVVPVEDLRQDSDAVVARACRWWDVPASAVPPSGPVNPAPGAARREALRRVNLLRRSEANPFPVADLFDAPLGRVAIRGLTAWYQRRGAPGLLAPEDEEAVREHVAASNARLRDLLGRDLPGYA